MKKIILNILAILFLVVLVSGAVVLLNMKPADIQVGRIDKSKQYEGYVNFTKDKTAMSCYLSEDKIDAGDLASCLNCDINKSNGEILCEEKPTNIIDWNGNVLQEIDINGTMFYGFNETELKTEACNEIRMDYDGKDCIELEEEI